MTRGRYPLVAIGEAQRRAVSWGFALFLIVSGEKLPFDFVIGDGRRISIVRVRRLKYAGYGTADIARTCACEIAALRALAVPEGICRELWVRGPDRSWHRYLVLPDAIEALDKLENGDGMHEDETQDDGMEDMIPFPAGLCALQPAPPAETEGLPERTGAPELNGQPVKTDVPEPTGQPEKSDVPDSTEQLRTTVVPKGNGTPGNPV
jgi:hypothetical protein